MTYGTKVFKNGKRISYLTFKSGKRVVLKHKDALEFDAKMKEIEYGGQLKEQFRNDKKWK